MCLAVFLAASIVFCILWSEVHQKFGVNLSNFGVTAFYRGILHLLYIGGSCSMSSLNFAIHSLMHIKRCDTYDLITLATFSVYLELNLCCVLHFSMTSCLRRLKHYLVTNGVEISVNTVFVIAMSVTGSFVWAQVNRINVYCTDVLYICGSVYVVPRLLEVVTSLL